VAEDTTGRGAAAGDRRQRRPLGLRGALHRGLPGHGEQAVCLQGVLRGFRVVDEPKMLSRSFGGLVDSSFGGKFYRSAKWR